MCVLRFHRYEKKSRIVSLGEASAIKVTFHPRTSIRRIARSLTASFFILHLEAFYCVIDEDGRPFICFQEAGESLPSAGAAHIICKLMRERTRQTQHCNVHMRESLIMMEGCFIVAWKSPAVYKNHVECGGISRCTRLLSFASNSFPTPVVVRQKMATTTTALPSFDGTVSWQARPWLTGD